MEKATYTTCKANLWGQQTETWTAQQLKTEIIFKKLTK